MTFYLKEKKKEAESPPLMPHLEESWEGIERFRGKFLYLYRPLYFQSSHFQIYLSYLSLIITLENWLSLIPSLKKKKTQIEVNAFSEIGRLASQWMGHTSQPGVLTQSIILSPLCFAALMKTGQITWRLPVCSIDSCFNSTDLN